LKIKITIINFKVMRNDSLRLPFESTNASKPNSKSFKLYTLSIVDASKVSKHFFESATNARCKLPEYLDGK